MSLSDLASHFFKVVIALLGVMAMDYALLEGRNTRQAVMEFERMAGDAPAQFNRLIRGAISIDWNH